MTGSQQRQSVATMIANRWAKARSSLRWVDLTATAEERIVPNILTYAQEMNTKEAALIAININAEYSQPWKHTSILELGTSVKLACQATLVLLFSLSVCLGVDNHDISRTKSCKRFIHYTILAAGPAFGGLLANQRATRSGSPRNPTAHPRSPEPPRRDLAYTL